MNKLIDTGKLDKDISKEILDSKLVLFILLGIVPLLSAGFDHDIIFWALLISTVVLIGNVATYKKYYYIEILSPSFILVLFLLCSFMSIFWSINYVRSIIEWLQLFLYFLAFILTMKLSDKALDKVIRIAFFTAFLVAAFGILEYIFINNSRILSTFTNPNPFGIYLSMIFLFTWSLFLHEINPPFKIKTLFLLSLTFLIALILSASRGAILALIFSLPIIFLFIPKGRLLKSIFYTFIFILISIIISNIIIQLASFIQDKLFDKSLFDTVARLESNVPNSVTGRLEFWKVGLNLIKHHPLKGFGLGSFFSAYYIEYNLNEWYSRFAHNHYLQIIVELGFVGLFIFFSFLFISAKNIIKNFSKENFSRYSIGGLSASIAFLLHIFIDFSWNFPAVGILFFYFLAIALRKSKSTENKNIYKDSESKINKYDKFYKENFESNKKTIPFKLKIPPKTMIILLAFVFCLTSWQYLSNRILIKGVNLMESNSEKALEYIELGNTIYPINSKAKYFESKIYLDKYKEEESIDQLNKAVLLSKKAIDLAPYDGVLHNHLGNLYILSKDYSKAENELLLSVKYGAYNLSNYLDLARVYNLMKQPYKEKSILIDSLELIPHAIKRTPENDRPNTLVRAAVIHHRLSNIYEEKRKNNLAIYHSAKEREYLTKAFNGEE